MFCMECGTKLPDNAKFCMNCGTPVGRMEPDTPAKPAGRSTPVRSSAGCCTPGKRYKMFLTPQDVENGGGKVDLKGTELSAKGFYYYTRLDDGTVVGWVYGHTDTYQGEFDHYYNLYRLDPDKTVTFLGAGSRSGIGGMFVQDGYAYWDGYGVAMGQQAGKYRKNIFDNSPAEPVAEFPAEETPATGNLFGSEAEEYPSIDDLLRAMNTPPSVSWEMGCSEKQGNMVYVPGHGLFLLYENTNLCFIPEGGSKAKFITRKSKYSVELDGLNYYNGKLYYWRYSEGGGSCGTALMKMDVSTFEKEEVRLSEEISPDLCGYKCLPVINGTMYTTVRNKLRLIDLDTGKVSYKPLPDMRTRAMPKEWMDLLEAENKLRHTNLNQDEVNYGFEYNGFAAFDGYGYVDRGGYPEMVVRFKLDDPSDFEYMPLNSCCVLRGFKDSMISSCKDGLLCVGVGEGNSLKPDVLSVVGLSEDGRLGSIRKLLDLKQYGVERCSWWKLSDSQFVIGNLMLNMETYKGTKLKFFLSATDYAPGPNGSTYVYDGETVYSFPPQFWTQMASKDDLKKFVVATL